MNKLVMIDEKFLNKMLRNNYLKYLTTKYTDKEKYNKVIHDVCIELGLEYIER